MKIKNTIRFVVQTLARHIPFVALNPAPCAARPEQLPLDLDHPTASGLPLGEAISVRSAEFWLQLGQPDQALRELHNLSETASRHDWPQRVRHQAAIAFAA